MFTIKVSVLVEWTLMDRSLKINKGSKLDFVFILFLVEMFRYPFSLPDTDSDTLAQGIGRYRVLIRYLGVYLYIQLYVLLALYELIRVIYGVLQTNPLIKHEQIHSELEYFYYLTYI